MTTIYHKFFKAKNKQTNKIVDVQSVNISGDDLFTFVVNNNFVCDQTYLLANFEVLTN